MTESILDIRDRLRPAVLIPGQITVDEAIAETLAEKPDAPEQARTAAPAAFAVESQETGKIVITIPAQRETAEVRADDFLLHLSGRLVEAEKANANGAFWSYGDLEFGLPTVAYGPLNWLHQERKVVGVLTQAQMIRPAEKVGDGVIGREAARDIVSAGTINPHIRADAQMWKWLYPAEAREVERAAMDRQLWYSMECISRKMECVGENGCGAIVDYRERSGANACSHLRERSSHRRLVDPIFQGAAIIVPPVRPGWADADLAVTRQAAAMVEDNQMDLPNLDTAQAEAMVAQVLAYANAR